MKAVVQHSYGDPEVLALENIPDPVARTGWTIVRLRAAALNWHDVLVRRGQYSSPLPHTPGADGAGIDLATDDDVIVLPSLWWGDNERAPGRDWEILGDYRGGTYAEQVAVPNQCVFPRPRNLTWAEAAALPLVGVTTYRALFTRARLQEGETLLVLGAGGGVATMAVALGAAVGASVYVTSSSQEKIDRAIDLGACGGVRYDKADWVDSARQLTGGRGFDVVLDSVGNWSDSVQTLRPGGRVSVLGASYRGQASLDVRQFYFGQFDLLGTTMGSPQDFNGLLALFDRYSVPPPVIDRTFDLDDVVSAHKRLESGTGFGKVILDI